MDLVVPEGVLAAVSEVTATRDTSALTEADGIGSVTTLRKNQFVTSRHLAKRLLSKFGCEDSQIGRTEDGAPVWPRGMCGSISYKELWCAVAVAKSPQYSSIGIDIERMEDIPCIAWDDIVSSKELQCISHTTGLPKPQIVNLAFTVKEAYFKAQYPITGDAEWDFPDVELRVRSNGQLSLSPLLPKLDATVGLRWNLCWCVASVAMRK